MTEQKSTNKIFVVVVVVLIVAVLGVGGYFIYKYQIASTQKATASPTPTSNASPLSQGFSSKNDPNGPYYHQIYSATSTDGVTWEKQINLLFDHASVPGAVIKNNNIYLYFVDASGNSGDQLSVAISKDLGKSFEKQQVKIKDATLPAVDPNPVLLDNGKIRLYYFASPVSTGDPAKASGQHQIMSAESNDGINFENVSEVFAEENITDPDVFKTNNDWRMFLSEGQKLILAISTDSGVTFKKDDSFAWNKGGVCDTIKIGDVYRTFYCGEGGINSATGAETGKLTGEDEVRLPSEQGQITCDPSVIQLPDGTYLMFYKTQKPSQNNPPKK